jgi:hypothetical protein
MHRRTKVVLVALTLAMALALPAAALESESGYKDWAQRSPR